MTKIINTYNFAFAILVFCYLNFYFLSPFIHVHPIEIQDHIETEETLHSHLGSIIDISPNDSESLVYTKASHSHNFTFNKPIINQFSQILKNLVVASYLYSEDENYLEFTKKFEVISSPKVYKQVLWEKYVHFSSNSSPPIAYHIV